MEGKPRPPSPALPTTPPPEKTASNHARGHSSPLPLPPTFQLWILSAQFILQDEEGGMPRGCQIAPNISNLLLSKASWEEHGTHSLGWPERHWPISQQTWPV